VSRSSAEAEYRAIAHTACEMAWLKNLLMRLVLDSLDQCLCIVIISLSSVAQNLTFHERTKHIEIEYHFVRDAWTKKVVMFQFTPSSKQLADLLTKTTSPQV